MNHLIQLLIFREDRACFDITNLNHELYTPPLKLVVGQLRILSKVVASELFQDAISKRLEELKWAENGEHGKSKVPEVK